MPFIIANATGSELLWVAAPVLLILSAVITFEIAAALTISTLPRSRAQQQWTPHERKRVARLFGAVLLIWPAIAGAFLAYLFLSPVWATVAYILAGLLFVFVVCCITRAMSRRRRVMSGHCTGCLYDLRASLKSKHCPECGTAMEHHPAIKRLRKI